MQKSPPNNNYNPQPSFNQNYMQQPMINPEDIFDPTIAMNMALVLIAKAFKLNYSTPTNNNQRISSNPRNRQIAQSVQNLGIQNVGNQNGLIVVLRIVNPNVNQNGNGNVVAARAKGDLEEIEEVNANCILMANLQQALTSGTQTDKAPVYDTDFKSLAKEADESFAKHKALEYEIDRLLKAVVSQDIMSIVQNTLNPFSQKLENENVELEFRVLNYARENEHLKRTYKNLFDSINVTRAQTKTITDSLQQKLHDTIYENTKLRAQLFDKVSEQHDTTKGTSVNTQFRKQSILGKPPSSSK
ncbi:hypothetical protein Tco_0215540 [Tanacetum coccineum]